MKCKSCADPIPAKSRTGHCVNCRSRFNYWEDRSLGDIDNYLEILDKRQTRMVYIRRTNRKGR